MEKEKKVVKEKTKSKVTKSKVTKEKKSKKEDIKEVKEDKIEKLNDDNSIEEVKIDKLNDDDNIQEEDLNVPFGDQKENANNERTNTEEDLSVPFGDQIVSKNKDNQSNDEDIEKKLKEESKKDAEREQKDKERQKAIRKGKITFAVLILLFILLIQGCYELTVKIIFKPKKQAIVLGDVTNYITTSKNINFIDINNNIVYVYTCKSTCDIYNSSYQGFNELKDNNLAIINEVSLGKNVIYNYKNGEIISGYYDDIIPVKDFAYNRLQYFIVKNNDVYGVLNTTGEVLIDTEYQDLYVNDSNKSYNNYLIFEKDNKYGLLSLQNEVLVENTYDKLTFTDNYNNLIATNDNLKYLVDFNGNVLIKNGYNFIYPFTTTLLVGKNNKFSIINYNEEELTQEFSYTTIERTFVENDEITIEITNNGVEETYIYNVTTNEINKK